MHSTLSFDATITSLHVPLLCGGKVAIVKEGQELEELQQLLESGERWSVVKITPMHLDVMGRSFKDRSGAQCRVNAFVIGGEALAPSTARLWRQLYPQIRLINEYGPTETVVGCSTYTVEEVGEGDWTIPIGRPIANTRIYILDEHRRPAPIGVEGEIYIGGAGVARGYLNRPALTAERFVEDPYSSDPHSRLYKTGDVGRWRADGNIEFIGRNDHQVKIRGYRIELGEIEARLLSHARVKEAVVLAREDEPAEKRLVAYYTVTALADGDIEEVGAEALRAHLETVLPRYMVPVAYVQLQSLPLTPNGKVDRKGLPAPEGDGYAYREYEPPQGELEESIAQLWQELLGADRVGRHDNFFDLGGHSLLAVTLISRLREQGLQTDVRALFNTPTDRKSVV